MDPLPLAFREKSVTLGSGDDSTTSHIQTGCDGHHLSPSPERKGTDIRIRGRWADITTGSGRPKPTTHHVVSQEIRSGSSLQPKRPALPFPASLVRPKTPLWGSANRQRSRASLLLSGTSEGPFKGFDPHPASRSRDRSSRSDDPVEGACRSAEL
jgi:hypothetical protein